MPRLYICFLIFLAIVLHIGLSWVWVSVDGTVVFPSDGTWLSVFYYPLETLASIIAPFVLGCFLKSRGFLVGAVTGFIAGPVSFLITIKRWDWVPITFDLAPTFISDAIGTAILFSVVTAAGVFFRSSYGPNYALKGTSV